VPELPTSPFVSSRSASRTTWMRRAGLGLAGAVLVALIWFAVLAVHTRSGVDRLSLPALGEGAERAAVVSDPVEGERNVLVTTVGPSAEGAAPSATPETIALVHTSDVREDVIVVSFPVDLRIEVPGRGNLDLAAAYRIGGPSLLAETVERYSGLPLARYFELDLDQVVAATEQLGGVAVCLDDEVTDSGSGIRLPEGRRVLGARDAVAFLRAGSEDPATHALRVARQEVVVSEALGRATAGSTMLNPVRAWRSLGQLSRSVRTDRGTPFRSVASLGWVVPRTDAHRLRIVPVPTDQVDGGASGRPEDAEALFQALRTGAAVPGAVNGEGEGPTAPTETPVRVLNGAGVPELAAGAAEQLEERGFEVVETDNAESFEIGPTEIRHRPEDRRAAEALSRHLPGSRTVEGEGPEGELVVVVGHEFAEDRDLTPLDDAEEADKPGAPSAHEAAAASAATIGRCW
jgi:LCP family protein required for cell wall assembly